MAETYGHGMEGAGSFPGPHPSHPGLPETLVLHGMQPRPFSNPRLPTSHVTTLALCLTVTASHPSPHAKGPAGGDSILDSSYLHMCGRWESASLEVRASKVTVFPLAVSLQLAYNIIFVSSGQRSD